MATARTTTATGKPLTMLDRVVVAAACALGLLFVGGLLRWSRYGFDFTDEGFYLNWIATPWAFKASLTQFGFVYHPLYHLVGGNIAVLRQANILITLLLAWGFCARVLTRFLPADEDGGRADRTAIAAAAFVLSASSMLSFVYLYWWLPTPSYNGLAFQALLVAGTALMMAEREWSRTTAASAIILGISGWLAAMAKPTTGAALGVVCVAYLLATRRLTWRFALAAGGTVVLLLCGSALAIDGSFRAFAWRVAAGVKDDRLLAGRHSLAGAFRLDPIWLTLAEKTGLRVLAPITLALVAFGSWPRAYRAWVALSLAGIAAGGLAWGRAWTPGFPAAPFIGLQLWAVALGSVAGSLAVAPRRLFSGAGWQRIIAAACFALLPAAYVFGTNGNYWPSAASAGLFWLAACVPIVSSSEHLAARWRATLSLALVSQTVVIALVLVGIDHPYRQAQSLRLDDTSITLPRGGGRLLVSQRSARYLHHLGALAAANGFEPGTPVIDLTGHAPGALYAIGASPMGQAWMLGGYPGSAAFVSAALDRVPCAQIARAWVLTEPTGPRAIPADVLRGSGVDLGRDLQVVGHLASPAEDYPESSAEQLLKPVREPRVAEASCRATRGADVLDLRDYATR